MCGEKILETVYSIFTLVLFTFCTCCILRCLVCIVVSCLVCIVVSCLVCIVVILCVFVVLRVYCCFYFRCWTTGQKSVFGRSCDRPPRHRFFLVSLCLCGPSSSVLIATDNGLDDPGSNPGGDEIFRPSRPTLGPTQPPVKCVPGLSRG